MITFSHADSFHRDPQSTLVAFRWDFNDDGTWDYETIDLATKPTHVYYDDIGCGDEVLHRVVLQVEDNQGNTDIDDETVVIRINLYNHPPVADGAPGDSYPNYEVIAGHTVLLDASESYDPDAAQGDYIQSYEWDLNNDGTFDTFGITHSFAEVRAIPSPPRAPEARTRFGCRMGVLAAGPGDGLGTAALP